VFDSVEVDFGVTNNAFMHLEAAAAGICQIEAVLIPDTFSVYRPV